MLILLFYFLHFGNSTRPKRTRPPPTPTRSINSIPIRVSGGVVISIVIILSIIASVLFFVIKKRGYIFKLTRKDTQTSQSIDPHAIQSTNDVTLLPFRTTSRPSTAKELSPLLRANKDYSYSYEYYEEEEYYYSNENDPFLQKLKPGELSSSSGSELSIVKVTCDL